MNIAIFIVVAAAFHAVQVLCSDPSGEFETKYSFTGECDTFPIVYTTTNSSSTYKLQIVTQNVSCGFASTMVALQTSTYRSSVTSVFGSLRADTQSTAEQEISALRWWQNAADVEMLLRFVEFSPMLVKKEVYVYHPYASAIAHMTSIVSARDSSNRLTNGQRLNATLQRIRATCFYVLLSTKAPEQLATLSLKDTSVYAVQSCIVADFRTSCALRVPIPQAAQNSNEDETVLSARYAAVFVEGKGDSPVECVGLGSEDDKVAQRELFDALTGVAKPTAANSAAMFVGDLKSVPFRLLTPLQMSKLSANEQVALVEPSDRVRTGRIFPVQLVARANISDFQLFIRTKRDLSFVALNRRGSLSAWNLSVVDWDVVGDDKTYKLTATRNSVQRSSRRKSKEIVEASDGVTWRLVRELLFEVDPKASTRTGARLAYWPGPARPNVSNAVTLTISVSSLTPTDPLDLIAVFKRDPLLNTAVLNGVKQTFRLRVLATNENTQTGVISVRELSSSQLECSSEDYQAVEVASNCNFLYFQGTETHARSNVRIVVRYRKNSQTDVSDLESELLVNVYMPKPSVVQLSNSLLRPVADWLALPRRSTPRESDQSLAMATCQSYLQSQLATVQLLGYFYSTASQSDAKSTEQRNANSNELSWPTGDARLLVTHLFDWSRARLFGTNGSAVSSALRPVRTGSLTRVTVSAGRTEEIVTLKVFTNDGKREALSHTVQVTHEPVRLTLLQVSVLQLPTANSPSFHPNLPLHKRNLFTMFNQPFSFAIDYNTLRSVRLYDSVELPAAFYLELRLQFSDQTDSSLYDFDVDSYSLTFVPVSELADNAVLRLLRGTQKNVYNYTLVFQDPSVIRTLANENEPNALGGRLSLHIGQLLLRSSVTRDVLRTMNSTTARATLDCMDSLHLNDSALLASANVDLLVELRAELPTTDSDDTRDGELYEDEYTGVAQTAVTDEPDDDEVIDFAETTVSSTVSTTSTVSTSSISTAKPTTSPRNTTWNPNSWRVPTADAVSYEKEQPSVLSALTTPLAIALFCVVMAVTLSAIGMLVFCAARRRGARPPFRFVKSCAKRAAGSPTHSDVNGEWMWVGSGKGSSRQQQKRQRESAASLLRRSASDATGCVLPCSIDALPPAFTNDDLMRDRSTPVSLSFSNGTLPPMRRPPQYSPLAIDPGSRPLSTNLDAADPVYGNDDAGHYVGSQRPRLGTSSFIHPRSPSGSLNVPPFASTFAPSSPRLTINPLNSTLFTVPTQHANFVNQIGMHNCTTSAPDGHYGNQFTQFADQPVLIPIENVGQHQQFLATFSTQPAFTNQQAMFGNQAAAAYSEAQLAASGKTGNRLSRIAEHSDEDDEVDGVRRRKKHRLPDLCVQPQACSNFVAASVTMGRQAAPKQHQSQARRSKLDSGPLLSSFAANAQNDMEQYMDAGQLADDAFPRPPGNYNDAYLLPTSVYATMSRRPVCRVPPAQKEGFGVPFAEMNALSSNSCDYDVAAYYGDRGSKETYT